MNILLLSACGATHQWVQAGCARLEAPVETEVNRCDTVDFGLRVLQVHDDVHMIMVDAEPLEREAVNAIKVLWRACRSASLMVIASRPCADEMVSCVNAGALGYVPRATAPDALGRILAHVADGGLWLPELRRQHR